MNYALISIAVNTVLAIVLFPIFGFLSVAFATVVAAWVQVLLLARTLHKRAVFRPDKRLAERFPRIVAATLGMGFFLWLALGFTDEAADLLFGRRWIAVMLIAVLGGGVYGLLSLALGAVRPSDYKAYARQRP